MERVQRHIHNGSDSEQLDGSSILNCPLPAVTPLSVTVPGGTYTAAEQAIIAELQVAVNELVGRLQSIHIIQ